MKLFPRRVKELGIVSVIAITILSLAILSYIQNISDRSIRENLFEQQKLRQIESTQAISEQIGSDLNLLIIALNGLTNSIYFQQGDLVGEETKKLVQERYKQITGLTNVNKLLIIDENGTVVYSLAPVGMETFLGEDFSNRDWVQDTKRSREPVFSGGFESQDIFSIFISFPVIDRQTHKYLGIIAASIPTESFFAHYSRVHEISSQYLVALDGNGAILENGESESLIGKNFFSTSVQIYYGHNRLLNNLTSKLLSGGTGYAVFDYGNGEKFTTQSPVFVNAKPVYFIQIVTPTAQIYSQVHDILFNEQLKMLSLLGGTIVAIGVLIMFLIKWSESLNKEVERKTAELYESERKAKLLEESYEGVKKYLDKVLDEIKHTKK